MPECAKKCTKPWNYSRMRPATSEEVEKMICKSRRMALASDGVPHSVRKSAGKGGARTLRDLTSAFADGVKVPRRSWLALLPKGWTTALSSASERPEV